DGRALGRELLSALPFGQFLFLVKGFVADRIPALIAIEIEIAGVLHRLPDRLAGLVMGGLGGADETIARNIELRRHLAEISRYFIGEFARRHVAVARGLHHLEAM